MAQSCTCNADYIITFTVSYISTHFQSHLSLSHMNYILEDHQILLHDKGTDVAMGDAFSDTLTLAVHLHLHTQLKVENKWEGNKMY